MIFNHVSNNKGLVRFSLLILLAGVGLWFGCRSYKAGSLSDDLTTMLADCQRITGQVTMTAADRAILDQTYATIAQIAAKYKLTPPATTITPL